MGTNLWLSEGVFNREVFMRYFNNPEAFMKLMASMQSGIVATLTIFFATLIFSIPLGMVIALLRMNRRRIISVPVSLYILVMRARR